jgi:hypothetical protein
MQCVAAVANASHAEVGVALAVPLERDSNMLLMCS